MCGITGLVSFQEKIDIVDLVAMTNAIAHRGPDGEGQWINKSVGLGHRRLSIIDLSNAGAQPMSSKEGKYVITYNGEIYNYKEIRAILIKRGYVFLSNTDTEVVLNAYQEWGVNCLDQFNGMFAFAIWDKEKKSLFLARDRYGIKPLYYSLNQSGFYFGSEIKAILAHPAIKSEINKKGLIEYFTFQNFFSDQTLHQDIFMLPAGHYLEFDFSQNKIKGINQYWDFNFNSSNINISHDECLEQLKFLFKQAVERQLVADVEIGSYLSGGIDSGSITAVASSLLPNMRTFTVGFDLSSASGIEMSFDERYLAEIMSKHSKTEHYSMILKSGDMERCIKDLVYHIEEPRVGQSYPNFYAAKLASGFNKVVLSGAGGDELFAGYPWRYYRAIRSNSFNEYLDAYYLFWQRLIDNKQIKKVFKPIEADIKDVWTKDIMGSIFGKKGKAPKNTEEYIDLSLYFEAKTFLHGLLTIEDKLSMAHSLETRVPFMDNDLVDFATTIPSKFKLGNIHNVLRVNENELSKFLSQPNDGKVILRNAMQEFLPEEIFSGKKQGFSSPDSSWFKGESIDYVRDKLYNKNAKIYNYMDFTEVNSLVAKHFNGKDNKRLLIWSLINVEEWCNQFL